MDIEYSFTTMISNDSSTRMSDQLKINVDIASSLLYPHCPSMTKITVGKDVLKECRNIVKKSCFLREFFHSNINLESYNIHDPSNPYLCGIHKRNYNSISCDMNQGIDQSPDKETRLSNSSLNNNSTQQSNSDNMQQEFDFIDAGNDDSFSNEDFDNRVQQEKSGKCNHYHEVEREYFRSQLTQKQEIMIKCMQEIAYNVTKEEQTIEDEEICKILFRSLKSGVSYNVAMSLCDLLPNDFESALRIVIKNGSLTHGRLWFTTCENGHHCIALRYHCPFCFHLDNKLVPIYSCSECERKMKELDNKGDYFITKGQYICNHSRRTALNGFPIQTITMHLLSLFKNGKLLSIPNSSLEDQYKVITSSIDAGLFNSYTCRNRIYNYLELNAFGCASLLARYADGNPMIEAVKAFPNKEAEFCRSDKLNRLMDFGNKNHKINTSSNDRQKSTAKVPSKRYCLRNNPSINYWDMNNGRKTEKPKKKKTISYSIGDDFRSICVETTNKNIVSHDTYSIYDIISVDYEQSLRVFAKYFNDDYETVCKDRNKYFMFYLLMLTLEEKKQEITELLNKGGVFSNQLLFRLSSEGNRICKDLDNEITDFYSLVKRKFDELPQSLKRSMVSTNNERFNRLAKNIYFELPEGNYDVKDYVYFISLYEDSISLDSSLPNTVISYKINGIHSSDYNNFLFCPPLAILESEEFRDVFSYLVECEVIMGRHGFYVQESKSTFIHVRFVIESIDGDILAQYQMEGRPGGNSSYCSCFQECYSKNNCLYTRCFVNNQSQLIDSSFNYKVPVITYPCSNSSLLPFFSSISMLCKYDNNGVDNLLSGVECTNEQKKEIQDMETISRKIGFQRCFFWVPCYVNDKFNDIYLASIIASVLNNPLLKSKNHILSLFSNPVDKTGFYLIQDHTESIRILNMPDLQRIFKFIIGFNGLVESPVNNLSQLSIIAVPSDMSKAIDFMHFISNLVKQFLKILNVMRVNSMKSFRDFYERILYFSFDDGSDVFTQMKTLFLPKTVFQFAEKRMEEIRRMNSNVPNWFHDNILSFIQTDKIHVKSHEPSSINSLNCHDQIIFFLCFFEVIFIDSMNFPLIFCMAQISRCLSYLYGFNNGKITDLNDCSIKLYFYANQLMNLLPPSLINPTLHRLCHLADCIKNTGFAKFHDNFRNETLLGVITSVTQHVNSKVSVAANNKLYAFYHSRLGHDDTYYSNEFIYDVIDNDDVFGLRYILDSAPLKELVLHSYLDDMYLQKNDSDYYKSLCDIMPSFGMSTSFGDVIDSLNAFLMKQDKTINNFNVTVDQNIYKELKINLTGINSKKKESISFSAFSFPDDNQLHIPIITEQLNVDNLQELGKKIAVTVDCNLRIRCYLIYGILSTKVNNEDYPLAICIPLNEEHSLCQQSRHFILLSAKINIDNITLISFNRLNVNHCVIARSLYYNTFYVCIPSLFTGQNNMKFRVGLSSNNDSANDSVIVSIIKSTINKYQERIKSLYILLNKYLTRNQ